MTTTQRELSNEASRYEKKVFVSYAWGDESERKVDELEQAFAEHGIQIVRDKKSLEYKGSIKKFEQRIGQGKCIILVISDKYLRSEHCMHELVEVNKNQVLPERIFPIVLVDAQIYKAGERSIYIRYWEKKIEELRQDIKQTDLTDIENIMADLNKYKRIRDSFDHLTALLSDMNALTPEMHINSGFSTLISAVENAMAGKQTGSQNGEVKVQPDEIVGTANIDDLTQALRIDLEYFQESCAIINEQLRPSWATRQFAMQYVNIREEWPDEDPEAWRDREDLDAALYFAKQHVKNQKQRLKKYNELTEKEVKKPEVVDLLLNDINHLYALVTLQELSSSLNDDWEKYLDIYGKLYIGSASFYPYRTELVPILISWKDGINSGRIVTEQVSNEYQEIHAWLKSQSQRMDDWINNHIKGISRNGYLDFFIQKEL
jgi:hypothetical protein